mgnify:FL=1
MKPDLRINVAPADGILFPRATLGGVLVASQELHKTVVVARTFYGERLQTESNSARRPAEMMKFDSAFLSSKTGSCEYT